MRKLQCLVLSAAFAAGTLPGAQAGEVRSSDSYTAHSERKPGDWAVERAFDTGPSHSIEQLVLQLNAAIDQLSRHRVPKQPVQIYRMSNEELQRHVCETNCAIKAWYKPGVGIFLDDSLQPETDVFDRSILLHELVHYFQDVAGYYGNAQPCDRWLQRELDAYAVQNRYLGTIGSPKRVAYAGNNCHARSIGNDGIIRRQVFNGTARDVEPDH